MGCGVTLKTILANDRIFLISAIISAIISATIVEGSFAIIWRLLNYCLTAY